MVPTGGQVKRALLVGIDAYDHSPALTGCVNDVEALRPLLARNVDDSPNFECRTLVGPPDRVTRPTVLTALAGLCAPGADVALFYFAGHGRSGGEDVTLVTTEGTEHAWGVGFAEVMGLVMGSPVPEIHVILDCCFSGAAGAVPQLGSAAATLRSGVAILTASRPDQVSTETSGRGRFSVMLCGGLDGGAADVLGQVTAAGLYAYLTESFGAFDARPMLKANIDRLRAIRTCRPWVDPAELRRLPTLFETEDAPLRLDPGYEPTSGLAIPEKEHDFALLQRCRDARLVEPVDEEHLYYVAMHSGTCRLTPLGRHYWRMARSGRV
ncbi:caspase family protein [Occultella glacieicola]|uniref:Caspase family protein n=2 Tax=Occultella glacieicola TaxID=2518684 RepID=A0ABY2E8M6_9MICO|nr:caspase family protein [Occultella glacieicola]